MDKKIKILLVDDEDDFRQLMKFWLESKGYSVIDAADGRTAIGMVKKEKPQIVFLDLHMPEMDGVATLRCIRDFNKEIPIIVISAYLDDLKLKDTVDLKISGVFHKGKNFEEGLILIETALRRHKEL